MIRLCPAFESVFDCYEQALTYLSFTVFVQFLSSPSTLCDWFCCSSDNNNRLHVEIQFVELFFATLLGEGFDHTAFLSR